MRYDWTVTVNLDDNEEGHLEFQEMTADEVVSKSREIFPKATSLVMVTSFPT